MTTRPHLQPAKPQRAAAAAPGTRDEKALPRSETGIIMQERKSHFNDFIRLEDGSLKLDDKNWVVWQAHMITKFQRCGVEGYINGTIRCPDPAVDLEGVENWSCNDNFARVLISWNVTPPEQVHILGCDSAREMWKNLEDVHGSEPKGFYMQWRQLLSITAEEGDNIIEHLDKLRQCRDRINFKAIGGKQFKITDSFFNSIIATSLPRSWDSFSETIIEGASDLGKLSPQRYIDLVERDYRARELWDREYTKTMYCKVCKKRNHDTEDCPHHGQPRCGGCWKFGHGASECRKTRR